MEDSGRWRECRDDDTVAVIADPSIRIPETASEENFRNMAGLHALSNAVTNEQEFTERIAETKELRTSIVPTHGAKPSKALFTLINQSVVFSAAQVVLKPLPVLLFTKWIVARNDQHP